MPYGETVYEPFCDAAEYQAIRTRSFGGQLSSLMDVGCVFFNEQNSSKPIFFSDKTFGSFIYNRECWFNSSQLLGALRDNLKAMGVNFTKAQVELIRPHESRKFAVFLLTIHSSCG